MEGGPIVVEGEQRAALKNGGLRCMNSKTNSNFYVHSWFEQNSQ